MSLAGSQTSLVLQQGTQYPAFGVLGVLVAAPLVVIVDILHDDLYRKRFLPMITDADLDYLARNALREEQSVGK